MNNGAIKIPLIYVAFGILWITLSDSVILWISNGHGNYLFNFLSTGKGILFMVISGMVLYILLDKHQKRNLREELQYRNIYEGNPSPIWFYDPKTFNFLSVNDAAIAAYGYSREEFLQMNIMDIRPAEDAEKVKASYSKMTDRLHESGIWRHIKKDGTIIYVTISSHKTRWNEQDVVMVMARDNTEKYLYEMRLEEVNTELTMQKIEMMKNYTRLEDTLNSITDSFFTINRYWTITQANSNFYKVTQVGEDVTGKHLEEVFPELHSDDFYHLAVRVMEERVALKQEGYTTVLNKWINFSCFPTEEGIAIYFNDITAEKQKDLELKQAVERYDLASRATGDVIYDLDLVTRSLVLNKQISALTNEELPPAEYTLAWWGELIHPDEITRVRDQQSNRIAAGEKYMEFEYRINAGGGKYKYVCDQSYLILDDNGQPSRLIGSIKDIDLLKRSTEQLKWNGEILKKINNPVIISNAAGVIIWVNPAFTTVTGYTEEEAIGKNHMNILFSFKTNRLTVQQLLEAVKKKEAFSADLLNHTKSNREYWVSLNLSPIFDISGKLECYISVQNDITERKEREAVIGLQNEKLKAVSWLNSHEIRKPVASILALASLMKNSTDEEEKLELLEMLNRCAVELDEIIIEINAEASGDYIPI